jgi:ring-1,2-phenylacetyl-CoA epoxidase subunit PaaC
MTMNIKINNPVSKYAVRIGDTSLVLGQRLGQLCGHGPVLEEDIAMTNISLDLIGQARAFLTYAGEINDTKYSEDDIAFFRSDREFTNTLLAEQPNGDFAHTMLRQLFISAFQFYFFDALKKSSDKTFSALAEKSLKEVTYHLRHASEWIYRLGDGTEESRRRTLRAVDELWRYSGDLFTMDDLDKELIAKGIGVDLEKVRTQWIAKISDVFSKAGLSVPADAVFITGGIKGKHTEYLGHLLSEMQILPRSMPGLEW